MKENLLSECLAEARTLNKSSTITEHDIRDFFCTRCRNHLCVNAGAGDSAWLTRMNTQVERLFNAPVADPNDPVYKAVVEQEFRDMTQRAMQIIVSAQRGDWEVPQMDEQPKIILPPGFQEHDPEPEPEEAEVEVEVPDYWTEVEQAKAPEPPSRPQQPLKPPTRQAVTNVPQRTGILIGEPEPASSTSPAPDPWAVPVKKAPTTPVGGTFVFPGKEEKK